MLVFDILLVWESENWREIWLNCQNIVEKGLAVATLRG